MLARLDAHTGRKALFGRGRLVVLFPRFMGLTATSLRLSVGAKLLLDGVDLDVNSGDCVVLVGANGAGKTTLLRALLGLVPATGEVRVDDEPLRSLTPTQRAERLGWLPQSLRLAEPIAAVELVATGRYRFGETRAGREKAARHALAELGVGALADRLVDTLSGGERQRVALASLVAQEAGLWLLDEPASHLDPGVQESVYGFLFDQWRQGKSLVMVTHDADLLLRVTSPVEAERVRVVGLAKGRTVFDTRLSDEALADQLGELYGVTMRWIDLGERRSLAVVGAR
ncbi:MAG: ABC transporter ATP-binding protein [Proteobacteria bacterium]|nr:ABC transporter ATP-binding protein [Pseudomonadota bacterium]